MISSTLVRLEANGNENIAALLINFDCISEGIVSNIICKERQC
jgi:hypothetical protein